MNQYFVSIERELFQSAYADSFEAASLAEAEEYVRELMGVDDLDSCAFLSEYSSGECTNMLTFHP